MVFPTTVTIMLNIIGNITIKTLYLSVPYIAVSYNGMFPIMLPPIMVIFNDRYMGLTVITVPL